jgi:hypothetical protein
MDELVKTLRSEAEWWRKEYEGHQVWVPDIGQTLAAAADEIEYLQEWSKIQSKTIIELGLRVKELQTKDKN